VRRSGPPSTNPFSPRNPLAPSYLCVLLYSMGEQALHTLVSPYLADQGYQPAVIGTVAAVMAVSSLLTRLPTGVLYRASRARWMLLGGGLVSATCFALVPLVSGAVPFAILTGLDGVGWAVATTVQMTVLVASRPQGLTIAAAMGWYSGFVGLGNTLGGATSGALADHLGFDAAFLFLACLPALGTLVQLRALPRATALPSTVSAGKEGHGLRGIVLRGLPAGVGAGFVVMVFINLVSGVVSTFHPLMSLAAGLSLSQIGFLSSSRSLASSITRLGSGAVFARVKAERLTTPLMLVSCSALALMPAMRGSFWLSVPLFLFVGLSRGLLRVSGSAQAFEAGGDSERRQGMVSALLNSGLDLGKVAGPPLAGLVAQATGVPTMFVLIAAALLLLYAVPVAAVRRRRLVRVGESTG
jgi:predicted MFS family arabinose efflux permease